MNGLQQIVVVGWWTDGWPGLVSIPFRVQLRVQFCLKFLSIAKAFATWSAGPPFFPVAQWNKVHPAPLLNAAIPAFSLYKSWGFPRPIHNRVFAVISPVVISCLDFSSIACFDEKLLLLWPKIIFWSSISTMNDENVWISLIWHPVVDDIQSKCQRLWISNPMM